MRFITDDPKQKSLPIVESSNKRENPLYSDKNISLPLTYNRMAKENWSYVNLSDLGLLSILFAPSTMSAAAPVKLFGRAPAKQRFSWYETTTFVAAILVL